MTGEKGEKKELSKDSSVMQSSVITEVAKRDIKAKGMEQA